MNDTTPLTDLGRLVRVRREEQHVTREQLAAAVDTSTSTLQRLERGDRRTRVEVIARVARHLEITAEEIAGTVSDPGLAGEIAGRLNTSALGRVMAHLSAGRAGEDDLIAFDDANGQVHLTLKNLDDQARQDLVTALGRLGYNVARPVI